MQLQEDRLFEDVLRLIDSRIVEAGTAQGDVSLDHAKFNVLPWLGKVTLMVGLPDLSGVEVDKATSDFMWKDGALHLHFTPIA